MNSVLCDRLLFFWYPCDFSSIQIELITLHLLPEQFIHLTMILVFVFSRISNYLFIQHIILASTEQAAEKYDK